jgi:hypothetical protein
MGQHQTPVNPFPNCLPKVSLLVGIRPPVNPYSSLPQLSLWVSLRPLVNPNRCLSQVSLWVSIIPPVKGKIEI